MGISPIHFSEDTKTIPNPNPYRFKILETKEIGNYLIVKVNYPDCTTYNGDKILIYKNLTKLNLYTLKILDPHFLENDLSPICRCPGNDEGWDLAEKFCITCMLFDYNRETSNVPGNN